MQRDEYYPARLKYYNIRIVINNQVEGGDGQTSSTQETETIPLCQEC